MSKTLYTAACFLLMLAGLPFLGCAREETAAKSERPVQIAHLGFFLPARNTLMTATKAAQIAERIHKEQQAPAFSEAFRFYSAGNYAGARKICNENESSGNSMLLYLKAWMLFAPQNPEPNDYLNSPERQQAVSLLQTACAMDNPYAMSHMGELAEWYGGMSHNDNEWRTKAIAYWEHRARAGDEQAICERDGYNIGSEQKYASKCAKMRLFSFE